MKFLTVAVAIMALCVIPSSPAKKKASTYFTICHRSDPDLNNCLKQVLLDLRPRLLKGIPELNIVPLEPLVIPRMEYREGSGNFAFTQVSTNVTMHGLGNYDIKNITFELNKLLMHIHLTTPWMRMTSNYEMEGKILLVPIRGSGDCQFNFTGVTTIAHVQAQKVRRNGEDYLEVEEFKWDIDVEDTKLHFSNLFNGEKTLGKATNDFLNENWREAFKIYKHLPEEALGAVFKEFANNVYKIFPYEELFPE